jgi:molybdenum cofactor cytidylyltransferase
MLSGLILAAGESSRMGRDKALLTYRGSTFLEHIVGTLHDAGIERVMVVLGHHASEIQSALNLHGTQVVLNHDYRLGQTSSLQAGLRALDQQDVQAVLLCLVDHPAVSVEVVKQLMHAYEKSHSPVVIPTYQGRRGHPVLISRELFAEILALGSGEGANTVIRKYREATNFVEVSDSGILIDVDEPQTLNELEKHSAAGR